MIPTLPPVVAPLLPEELLPVNGSDWNVCEPVRTTDGDTQRIIRAQVRWTLNTHSKVATGLIRESWSVEVIKDNKDHFPRGLAGRLINIDTPERGDDGYETASRDLEQFCAIYRDRLRCVVYDTGGGFDRLLIDLYVLDADGKTILTSASQHMLRLGWQPYLDRKAKSEGPPPSR